MCMKLLGAFAILLLIVILLYAVFYPKTNAIYKDEHGSQAKVLEIHGNTVVIQYVKYNVDTDEITDITGPQNISLIEFIESFNLWILL